MAFERLEFQLDGLAGEPVDAPLGLKTRVLARLDDVGAPRRRWSWFTARRLLACSTALLAFFAGLLVREVRRANDWLAVRGREVVLEFQAPQAQQVTLAGDFNGWGKGAVSTQEHDGRWVFRLRLEPGRYQYSFVVDGKKWLPDPRAPGNIPDGFGGVNSVLYVPARPSRSDRVLEF